MNVSELLLASYASPSSLLRLVTRDIYDAFSVPDDYRLSQASITVEAYGTPARLEVWFNIPGGGRYYASTPIISKGSIAEMRCKLMFAAVAAELMRLGFQEATPPDHVVKEGRMLFLWGRRRMSVRVMPSGSCRVKVSYDVYLRRTRYWGLLRALRVLGPRYAVLPDCTDGWCRVEGWEEVEYAGTPAETAGRVVEAMGRVYRNLRKFEAYVYALHAARRELHAELEKLPQKVVAMLGYLSAAGERRMATRADAALALLGVRACESFGDAAGSAVPAAGDVVVAGYSMRSVLESLLRDPDLARQALGQLYDAIQVS